MEKVLLSGKKLSVTELTLSERLVINSGEYELASGKTYHAAVTDLSGGMVLVNGGTLSGTGVSFVGNTVTGTASGGAICNQNEGTVRLSGATFSQNYADNSGGAIYNEGEVSLDGTTLFVDNDAVSSGGAVYNVGTLSFNGDLTLKSDTDTIYNAGVLNWNLIDGLTSYATLDGYRNLTNDGDLTITVRVTSEVGFYTIATGVEKSELTNAKKMFTLKTQGGDETALIVVNGSIVNLNNSGYQLTQDGVGADIVLRVYDQRIVVAQKSSTTVSDNSYTMAPYVGNGGAVNVSEGGLFNAIDVTFSANTATVNQRKSASLNGYGGAIFNAGTTSLTGKINFEDNHALFGGAIANVGVLTFTGEINLSTESDTVFNAGVFNWDITGGLSAGATINGYKYFMNGAFLTRSGFLSITVTADQECGEYTIATGVEGSMLTAGKRTFTLVSDGDPDGMAITVNSYSVKYGERYYQLIQTADGENIVLKVQEDAPDERIIVFPGESKDIQYGASYTLNPFTGSGGVAYVYAGGTLTGNEVRFYGNSASAYGGALWNKGNTAFRTVDFEANNASRGGAIYSYSSGNETLSVDNGTFTNNIASSFGGAVYNSGNAEFTGVTLFSGNQTLNASGGALYNNTTDVVTIKDARFVNNMAGNNGGAIFNVGLLTMGNVLFAGNTAGNCGAAIWNSGTLTMESGTFARNAAQGDGSTIWNAGTITFNGDILFYNNHSSSNNYSIYNRAASTLNFSKKMTLSTETDTFRNFGTLNWDLTGGLSSYATLAGFRYLSNSPIQGGQLVITVDGKNQQPGIYTIGSNVEANFPSSKKTFSVKGVTDEGFTLTVNGDGMVVDGVCYSLTHDEKTAELLFEISTGFRLTSDSNALGVSGTFTVGGVTVTQANPRDTVNITAAALADARCIGVSSEQVKLTQIDENTYEFTMPSRNVKVTVKYAGTKFFVNSTYTETSCGGHAFGVNAFNNYNAALAAATDNQPVVQTGGDFTATHDLGFRGLTTRIEAGANKNVYGGYISSLCDVSTGLTIENGTFGGAFGGSWKDSSTRIAGVQGSNQLVISGGTFSAVVGGGDRVSSGSFTHSGDVTLAISGGSFARQVFGGMFSTDESADVALKGNVGFSIAGGVFTQSVFGGNAAQDRETSDRTLLTGDIAFTIDSSTNSVVFGTAESSAAVNIIVGSFGRGKVDGNAVLTFTGSGSNLSFTGTALGGSSDAYYSYGTGTQSMESYITGERKIVFDQFSGNFDGQIKMFTVFELKGSSQIDFNQADLNLSDVSVWKLEYGSSLTDIVYNDFADDTLSFDLTGWNEESWNVMSATSADGFGNWDKAGKVEFTSSGGKTVTGTWNEEKNAYVNTEKELAAYVEDNKMYVSKLA